jgi:dephospho-CoA kinase
VKLIALTGSIAMGKSEVARILREHGVPVLESDAVVHAIYADGSGAEVLRNEFAAAVKGDIVQRDVLSSMVLGAPEKLQRLEELIHPLVKAYQIDFIAGQRKKNAKAVVLDIPLLFETGDPSAFDAVVVVSAPEDWQRQWALTRKGMTEEKFRHILARQMSDSEKRKRATHIIENDGSLAELEKKTVDVLNRIMAEEKRI